MTLDTTTSRLRQKTIQRSRPAFTIIEIIVVVGIIIVLVAIIVPAIGAAKKGANKSANIAQLSAIQSGLQAYFTDFNLYPPSSPLVQPVNTTPGYTSILAGRGSAMLAEALMGYLNGNTAGTNDGAGATVNPGDPRFGFRTRAGGLGKIYGPYVSDDPKAFKVNLLDLATQTQPIDAAFIDIFGHEILYFASTQQGINGKTTGVPITNIFGVSAQPVNPATVNYYFDSADNKNYYTGTTVTSLTRRVYADGSTTAPLPSDTPVKSPVSATNVGPTNIFFQNLASTNTNTVGNGPVLGSNSFLLISIGEDANPYTDDDIIVSNR